MNGPPQWLRKKKHKRFKVILWDHQDGKCFYCGRQCIWWTYPLGVAVPGDAFTIEHVIPKRRGGSLKFTNLVGACLSCNNNQDWKLRAAEFILSSCGGLIEPKEDIWELDK
jgi:5-methylcytosine-specific restriction endonuclease McrA